MRIPTNEAELVPPRQPNLVRDITAIALVAVTFLLTISIVTHDPADPIETPVWPLSQLYSPDPSTYPLNETVTNACGYWGALAASALYDGVGLAAALVIAAAGGVATALLVRGQLNAPVLRSLGGTVVVLASATAAAMIPMRTASMPVVGAGGYLGAMTSAYMSEHFAPAGTWILTLTVLAVGLLLTTDYALLYAGRAIMSRGARVSRSGYERARQAMPLVVRRRRRPFSDLEDGISIEGDATDPLLPNPNAAPNTAAKSPTVMHPDADLLPSPNIKSSRPRRGDSGVSDVENQAPPAANPVVDVAKKAAAIGALGLAGAAVAKGLDSLGGKKSTDDIDPLTMIPEEEYAAEAVHEGDEEFEEETPAPVRELEIDNEVLSLRGDEEHEIPVPKIGLKKQKRAELAALKKSVQEQAPDGADEYVLPSIELLELSDDIDRDELERESNRRARLIIEAFKSFGIKIAITNIDVGPVITQFEIDLEAGLRLSKITSLSDDLAIALRVPSVRVVAPIPGRNTVGIEVPNETRQMVRLRDVIEEDYGNTKKMNIPVFLGKDVSGNPMVVDLAKMPHLLIAGRTGTGKSVCLNTIIASMLMTCRPDEVRMLMIDPKMVELSGYGRLPHLMHPVVTDMKKAEAILAWAVEKMEERYSLLAKVGVRHINSFNDLGREEVLRRLEVDEADGASGVPDKLPFIVIVADEMADLMMTAGKDVETHIIRLAQKSRAVGIHLILATQKPTVDVITGLIKSNLPARLSFQVASKTDSRVVLDENGADKLLGNGDMLFLWPGTSTLIRGQGTYLSDEEIDRVVDHCSMGEQNFVGELMNLKITDEDGADGGKTIESIKKRDELYDSAIEVVVREGRGSVSLLQRCLGIGYGRAARLIDYMAEDGIVGEYNGSQARDVLLTMDKWHALQGMEAESAAKEVVPPRTKPKAPVVKSVAKHEYEDEDDTDDQEEYEDVDEDEESWEEA